MFRSLASRAAGTLRSAILPNSRLAVARCMSSKKTETDDEFDARYEAYFSRPDIDGWGIRKAMNDLAGMDLVPEPKIVIAALKACRRVNDIALAIRILETVKEKSEAADKAIYPYMIQEIKGTLDELGIGTIEDLGYDKPELALQNVWEIH